MEFSSWVHSPLEPTVGSFPVAGVAAPTLAFPLYMGYWDISVTLPDAWPEWGVLGVLTMLSWQCCTHCVWRGRLTSQFWWLFTRVGWSTLCGPESLHLKRSSGLGDVVTNSSNYIPPGFPSLLGKHNFHHWIQCNILGKITFCQIEETSLLKVYIIKGLNVVRYFFGIYIIWEWQIIFFFSSILSTWQTRPWHFSKISFWWVWLFQCLVKYSYVWGFMRDSNNTFLFL